MKRRVMLPVTKSKRYAAGTATSSSSSSSTVAVEAEDAHIQQYLASGFSDSVAAFESIVREVSSTSGFPLAISGCFLHQIYAVIDDRTVVNMELQEAKFNGILRHLNVNGCGVLLVREKDYHNLLLRLIGSAEQDQSATAEQKVLRAFFEKVILRYRELGITEKKLLEMMEMQDEPDNLMHLLKMGFLVYKTPSVEIEYETAYWFSLPNLGTLTDEVHNARKEIVKMIKAARPFPELLKSKLRGKGKLKSSSMSISFHIKDIVGAKVVVCRDTAIEGPRSLFLLPDKLTSS